MKIIKTYFYEKDNLCIYGEFNKQVLLIALV